jgi:dienelactone hydrolase
VDPIDESGQGAAVVLPGEFGRVTAGWARYRGGFDGSVDDGTPRGRNVDMAHPYTPGWVTFDQETMGERFLNGAETDRRGAARDLDAETLWVRLPAGYDPRTPAGLLVWIDPTDSGQPPEFMHDAADALNFVVVGAAMAGNDRFISDRHQLMFDAMATAMSRYHVDASRVYAAGVSGGGRVACMYWACFPDVFAGAVAIVGTSSYEHVPMGNGAYMPRGFTLPTGARRELRGHRLAAVTGARDFNAMEVRQTLNIFDHDGFDVELFEYADMGHEFPTPARFTRALEWVDEPWREARAEAESRAGSMLEGFKRRHGGGALTPGEREALVRVTEAAPWSAPAWEAAVLLGLATAQEEPAEEPGAAQD